MAQKVWDPDIHLFSIKRLRSVFCLFPAKQRSADWSVSHQQSTQLSPGWNTNRVKSENNSIKYCTLCMRFLFFLISAYYRHLDCWVTKAIPSRCSMTWRLTCTRTLKWLTSSVYSTRKNRTWFSWRNLIWPKNSNRQSLICKRSTFILCFFFRSRVVQYGLEIYEPLRIEKVDMHLFNNMVIIAM